MSNIEESNGNPAFTTANPGYLSRLGSTQPMQSVPAQTASAEFAPIEEDEQSSHDVCKTDHSHEHKGDSKKDKKKNKKMKKGTKVLVYDNTHGYHYATIAGDEDEAAPNGVVVADDASVDTVSSDDELDESSVNGELTKEQRKAAKKAAKKAKKEAKKEAKRLAGGDEEEEKKEEKKDKKKDKKNTLEVPVETFSNNTNDSGATVEDDTEDKTEIPRGQINITGLKKPKQNAKYEAELAQLQIELVKLQAWIKHKGLKVVVIFEGRDAAGKGGVIKRILERLNPRICRVCALGTATEREKTQWYFQRYISQLPAAGEMVLFDRSWYNRGGVEKVMSFCSDEEYAEFMHSAPIFEDMLIRSGIILIKYWFSVSDDVQEKRFQGRIADSTKRWKLSPMDVESRNRWVEYSKAKDEMLKYTDTEAAPWIHVHADSKKLARLNCISHLLSTIPYQDLTPPATILPPRKHCQDYVRPPMSAMKWVAKKYA